MYVKQGDLFWGMSKDFVKEAMDNATKLAHEEGDVLFTAGDSAAHFYVLIKGRVMLSIGETGPTVYIARNAGELIGWSSLIGRDSFTATAKCVEPTNLLKIDRDSFLASLAKDDANGVILFKRLAETLSHRLLEVYPSVT